MFIDSLEAGKSVTVESRYNDNTISLDTLVIRLSDKDENCIKQIADKVNFKSFVALELLTDGDKVLNFTGRKVKSNITTIIDEKPYVWSDVKIFKFALPDGGSTHIAFCNEDVEAFNRRNEYRVSLGLEATVKIGDSGAVHDVLLKDISEHGFGFVISSKWNVHLGSNINLQFYNIEYSPVKKEKEKVLYKMHARVVRIVQSNNEKLLVGCRMEETGKMVKELVYMKQREKLKVNASERLAR